MNRKQFYLLLIAALALGAIALTLTKRESTAWEDASGRVGQSLLADLDINQVAQAIFTGAKGDTATLALKDGLWRLKERNDYPADFKGLSDLLIKLRELKIVQVEAIAPEQRAQLELGLPGKADNPGTLIELKDAAGKALATLLLGKEYMRKAGPGNASYPTGRFVMTAKDAAGLNEARSVFVVGDTLGVAQSTPQGWLRKDFFKVANIKSIAVKGADSAHTWKLARAKADDFWKLEGAAASEELDQINGNQAAGALEEMLLQDVAIGAADDVTGLAAPMTVTAQTFDNLNYEIKVGQKKDDTRYLRVALSGAPSKTRVPASGEKPEDKEKLDKAFNEQLAALETRLKLERALTDWTFTVPGWKLDPLLKSRAQLLVDKSKPRPPAQPGGMPPGMQGMPGMPGMPLPQQ